MMHTLLYNQTHMHESLDQIQTRMLHKPNSESATEYAWKFN